MTLSPTATRLGRLHVLVDSVELAEAALAGGADVLQVRVKDGSDRQRLQITREIVGRARRVDALTLVNDRVDLAVAAGADGVHLGADDLPIAIARRILDRAGDRATVVGGTAREPDQALAAVAAGADYLGVGPVFATGSKHGLPEAGGVARVRRVAAAVPVPVIAIAGITADRTPEVIAAGAFGVAVIGAVAHAPDPTVAVRELRAAIAAGLAEATDRAGS